jgi:MFS family permease
MTPPRTPGKAAPHPSPGAFASLRIRNFRLYIAGQLVSVTGQWMQIVSLSLLILDTTGSGTAVGLVPLLQYLPVLLLAPWAGAVLERARKHRLLLVSQAALGGLAAVLWGAAALDRLSLPVVLVYSGLFGLVQAIDNPARRVFVFEMVGPARIANAVALNSAVMVSARLIGPAAAGLVAATAGAAWCLLANALSYAAIVAALLLMRRAELNPDEARTTPGARSAADGLRYAIRTPQVLWTLGMTAVVSLLLQNYPVIVPLLAIRGENGGPEVVGLLFTALSSGSVLMAMVVAKLGRTGFGLVTGIAIGYGGIAAAASFSPGIAVLAALMVLLGAADQAFASTANATLQLITAPEFRSRVLALYSAFFVGTQGLSGLYVGALSDLFGPRTALLSAGTATVVAGLAAAVAARRGRRPR